jgi:DNA-binding NtrC family response regulator
MKESFEGLVQQLLSGNIYLEEAIELLERSMIKHTLESTEGNQSEASKRLGIHRNTLKKKLIVYGLANKRGSANRKTAGSENRQRKPNAGVA